MKDLHKLKQKIRKLLPDLKSIVECNHCEGRPWDCPGGDCPECGGAGEWAEYNKIGIAEVLRCFRKAIKKEDNINIDYHEKESGILFIAISSKGGVKDIIKWNLEKDNIDEQEKETIKLLNSIII